MSKTVRNLLILLVVQLMLVFAFSVKTNKLASFTPNDPLAKIQAAEITKLEIEQGNSSEAPESEANVSKKLSLVKDSGTWKLVDADNFPAAPTKIQTTLEKLAAMKKSFPVATSEIAARQLKASSSEFEKKLVVSEGDKKQTFYLGTSPTFKKVHIRVEGDSNTYAVDFSSYELSANVSDWLNKSFFSIPRDKIRKVKSGDLELKLDNNNPQIDGLEEKQELDVEKANSFIGKVSSLEFTDLATAEQKKKLEEKKPSFELSVEKTDNTIDTFQFIDGDSAEDIFLKLTSQPYFVKVAKTTLEDLKKVNKAALVKTKKSDESAKKEAAPSVTAPAAPAAAAPENINIESDPIDDGGMSMMPEGNEPPDGNTEMIPMIPEDANMQNEDAVSQQ